MPFDEMDLPLDKMDFYETICCIASAISEDYWRQVANDLVQTMPDNTQGETVVGCLVLLTTIALLGEGKAKDAAEFVLKNRMDEQAILAAIKLAGEVQ